MPVIDAPRLQYEMAVRGLIAGDLARVAGVDANTVTRALHGRPVTMRTVRMITSALLTQPLVRLTADLIARPAERDAAFGRPFTPTFRHERPPQGRLLHCKVTEPRCSAHTDGEATAT